MARSTTNRTGWWMADDAANLWQDTSGTSAITADGQIVKRMDEQVSGTYNMTEATNGPTWKSPSSLLLPALQFDGSNDRLRAGVGSTTAMVTTTAKTILVACRFLAAFPNNANIFDNDCLVGDATAAGGGRWFGLYGKNGTINMFNFDSNSDVASVAVSLNTNYVIMGRHDGTNVYISVNGGSETSATSGTTGGNGDEIWIGSNANTGTFMNVQIGEVAIYNAAITGSALSDTIAAMMADWVTAPTGNRRRRLLIGA